MLRHAIINKTTVNYLRKTRKWRQWDQPEREGHSGQAEARRPRPIGNGHRGTPFSQECAGSHGNSGLHATTRVESRIS